MSSASQDHVAGADVRLPSNLMLYYGGDWKAPISGGKADTFNPATSESIAQVADAAADDVDRAVDAARIAFAEWRDMPPGGRARILREMARIIRAHARELALLDSLNSGNPVSEMMRDAEIAAAQCEFFAGLVTEMKGASVPLGPSSVNFSVREPLGVVARIVPFNHPFMFTAARSAAPLTAGNTVIVKPPDQAPLTSLRLAELVGHLFPAGVFNVLPGGRDVGAALAAHPAVAKVAVTGSIAAGRAVMRGAADTIKPVLLELGGKNALIAFADSDPDEVAAAAVAGMNFAWCGQSCGSTSRALLHEQIYARVLSRMAEHASRFRPGTPTDPATTMGAIINKKQYDRVLNYIALARTEGAQLICGGKPPSDPKLARGFFIEPTIFAGVTPEMTIAREEIFGPVLAVMKWSDEKDMVNTVNSLEYGLTCSIWTRDLDAALRTASSVEAGFVWINEVSKHFLGAPFGGYKQSGIGREECLQELLDFTQEKNIHIRFGK